jgi:hypothetical protein
MTVRFALALAACWLTAGPALADPPKINRTIAREPVYRTKTPKYGVLAFGPEGKDQVWMVFDGDTLYVDRNGNGDLTEPSEKIAAEARKPGSDPEAVAYIFDVGELSVGGRTQKGLRVSFVPLKRYADTEMGERPEVKASLAKDPKATAVTLTIDVEIPGMKGGGIGGRVLYLAGLVDLNGVFQFADSPAEAPAVHFGGPLEITLAERQKLRVGRETDLVLVVGTPGNGPGTFAMICYQDTIPEEAKPVAEFMFPGEPPTKETVTIRDRC